MCVCKDLCSIGSTGFMLSHSAEPHAFTWIKEGINWAWSYKWARVADTHIAELRSDWLISPESYLDPGCDSGVTLANSVEQGQLPVPVCQGVDYGAGELIED